MKDINIFCLILITVGFFSCRKSFEDPSQPKVDDLIKSQDGIVEMIVGIKNRYAVRAENGNSVVFNAITANALTTGELVLRPGGNQDINQLFAGGQNLASNNVVLKELWSNCLLINNYSTLIINNLGNIQDPALKNYVHQYANLYKALAIGTMANFWEELPVETGDNAQFVLRAEALKMAIGLLDEASVLSKGALPSQSYQYKLGTEINLKNSLLALSARYNCMLAEYDRKYYEMAIAKADSVDLAPGNPSSRSIFYFNNQNPNPVFYIGYNGAFAYFPNPTFGLTGSLAVDAADNNRRNFYVTNQPPSPGQSGYGFGKTANDGIPVYLPGEMLLIKAEAYARMNDLVNSEKFLNLVLQKKPAQDVFGIGADLPAYSGPKDTASLLKEIYKNRCIELFMSGNRLSDSRRFGRPGPTDPKPERNRTYYPYPLQERSGNPNTPKDPDN
jgi:hypothetical protein